LVAVAYYETETYDPKGRDNHQLAMFQAETGALARALPGFEDGIWRMDLDPAAARLAVIELAQRVDILDVETGRRLVEIPLPSDAELCRLSVDGDTLFAATMKPALLVQINLDASPPRLHRLELGDDDRLRPLCLNRDGGSVWALTEPNHSFMWAYDDQMRTVVPSVTELVLVDPMRGARTHPVRPASRRRGPAALSPSGDLIAYAVDTTIVIDRVTRIE